MAPHSSVLAWRIPGMGEPGGLPSMGSHRVGHDWSDLAAAAQCILQFSYYILQFCDFHFLLSYIFDLFVEILCVLPFFSPVRWVSFEPILWTLCQVNYYLHFSMVLSCWGFPGGSVVKNLPAIQEMRVRSLGQEDPLEKEMATHSNILPPEIPWTEEPGRLQSVEWQRGRHNSGTKQQQMKFMPKTKGAKAGILMY